MIARNMVWLVTFEVQDLGDEVDGVGYLDSSCMANSRWQDYHQQED
jgi:hypothetical protein